jgi:hypothetical protein
MGDDAGSADAVMAAAVVDRLISNGDHASGLNVTSAAGLVAVR